jgi:hypothetical protein
VEDVRGCNRRQSELCAFLRFNHSVAHRNREPCPATQLGPRGHHHGEPSARRGAAAIRPPEARALIPEARDPNRRWYGVYANYNTPAYNTNLVRKSELPKSYDEFLERRQWAGKIALDDTDDEWLSAMIAYHGEERGTKLLKDMVSVLKPVMVDGHLALARSVGAGEYWLALNNYASLTVNVQMSGAAIDFWPLDPVALFFGSVGISSQAPHPHAALLGAKLHPQPGSRAFPHQTRAHADPA